ncbi:MAG: hypothetical protein P8Y18_05065 [Candidatus Bathyarchaeota archaeon]
MNTKPAGINKQKSIHPSTLTERVNLNPLALGLKIKPQPKN